MAVESQIRISEIILFRFWVQTAPWMLRRYAPAQNQTLQVTAYVAYVCIEVRGLGTYSENQRYKAANELGPSLLRGITTVDKLRYTTLDKGLSVTILLVLSVGA